MDFKAAQELWNPLSNAVAGKFHRSVGQSKDNCLQHRANFQRSQAWQLVLSFNTTLHFVVKCHYKSVMSLSTSPGGDELTQVILGNHPTICYQGSANTVSCHGNVLNMSLLIVIRHTTYCPIHMDVTSVWTNIPEPCRENTVRSLTTEPLFFKILTTDCNTNIKPLPEKCWLGTKPLPATMLTWHQAITWTNVASSSTEFHSLHMGTSYFTSSAHDFNPKHVFWDYTFKITAISPQSQWVNIKSKTVILNGDIDQFIFTNSV